jgi:hypothetical protein
MSYKIRHGKVVKDALDSRGSRENGPFATHFARRSRAGTTRMRTIGDNL